MFSGFDAGHVVLHCSFDFSFPALDVAASGASSKTARRNRAG